MELTFVSFTSENPWKWQGRQSMLPIASREKEQYISVCRRNRSKEGRHCGTQGTRKCVTQNLPFRFSALLSPGKMLPSWAGSPFYFVFLRPSHYLVVKTLIIYRGDLAACSTLILIADSHRNLTLQNSSAFYHWTQASAVFHMVSPTL